MYLYEIKYGGYNHQLSWVESISNVTYNLCNYLIAWNDITENHYIMMTSWKHFRVTCPLWGEFTGDRWIPLTQASGAELWCFLWCAPEQRPSKQSRFRWFETSWRLLWRHCNVNPLMCAGMVSKPSGADAGIIPENWGNTIAADTLFPCVARLSAAVDYVGQLGYCLPCQKKDFNYPSY